VASGNGATLAEAVSAAATALAPAVHDLSAGRLELDIATAVDGVAVDRDTEVGLPAAGLEGVFVTRTSGASAAVLPAEIAEQGLFHAESPARLDHDRIAHLLARRARIDEIDLGTMRAYRYRTAAFVESPDHTRALPVFRGMVEGSPEVTTEVLLSAVRRGAEYLSRIVDDKGRYIYLYQPATDRDDGSYGWLRHAGTTYAIFEAYGALGSAALLSKGEQALAYLEAHLKDDPASQGKYLLDTDDEEQQKVGGAGLALLAFTKHAAVTGQRDRLDTMRGLARFIISRQYDDGRYRANADLPFEPGKKPKKEPVYYVGEAVLGLMRLYAIDPQPSYLDSARRAADWVVKVRDAIVSEDNQEHDHWISYAFNDLYRVTREEAYVEHAYKIARAILKKLHRDSDAPAWDWAGTFYEGQTTPGATRLEAFDADMALSRFAGKPDAWLMAPATQVARSTLRQQFTDDNDYFLPNPGKARGGVRESLYVQDVRIDYVQHAMSAWLHLALLMRDPEYGKTGVPSQDAVR
jgi:hypothetical protein